MDAKKALSTAGIILALGGVVASSVAFGVKNSQLEQQLLELKEKNDKTNQDLTILDSFTKTLQTEINAAKSKATQELLAKATELEEKITKVEKDLKEKITTVEKDLEEKITTVEEGLEDTQGILEGNLAPLLETIHTELSTEILALQAADSLLQEKDAKLIETLNQLIAAFNSLGDALYSEDPTNIGDIITLFSNDQYLLQMINSNKTVLEGKINDLVKALNTLIDNDIKNLKDEVTALKNQLDQEIQDRKDAIKEAIASLESVYVDVKTFNELYKQVQELSSNLDVSDSNIIQKLNAFNGLIDKDGEKVDVIEAKVSMINELIKQYIRYQKTLKDEYQATKSAVTEEAAKTRCDELDAEMTKIYENEMYYSMTTGIFSIEIAKNLDDAEEMFNETAAEMGNTVAFERFELRKMNVKVSLTGLVNLVDDFKGAKESFIADNNAVVLSKEDMNELKTQVEKAKYVADKLEELDAIQTLGTNYDTLVKKLNEKVLAVTKTNYETNYSAIQKFIDDHAKTAINFNVTTEGVPSYDKEAEGCTTVKAANELYAKFDDSLERYAILASRYVEITELVETVKGTIATDNLDEKDNWNTVMDAYLEIAARTEIDKEKSTDVNDGVDAILEKANVDALSYSCYFGIKGCEKAALATVQEHQDNIYDFGDDTRKAFDTIILAQMSFEQYRSETAKFDKSTEFDEYKEAYNAVVTGYETLAMYEASIQKIWHNTVDTIINEATLTVDERSYLVSVADKLALEARYVEQKVSPNDRISGDVYAVKAEYVIGDDPKLVTDLADKNYVANSAEFAKIESAVKTLADAHKALTTWQGTTETELNPLLENWVTGHSNGALKLQPTDHTNNDGRDIADENKTAFDAIVNTALAAEDYVFQPLPKLNDSSEINMKNLAAYLKDGIPSTKILDDTLKTAQDAWKTLEETLTKEFEKRDFALAEKHRGYYKNQIDEVANAKREAAALQETKDAITVKWNESVALVQSTKVSQDLDKIYEAFVKACDDLLLAEQAN